MVTIDGDEITGATIDGEEVTEITVDGDVVWTAATAPAVTMIDSFEDGDIAEYSNDTTHFGVVADSTTPTTARDGTNVLSDESATDAREIWSTTGLPAYFPTGTEAHVSVWNDTLSGGDVVHTLFGHSGTQLDAYSLEIRNASPGHDVRLHEYSSGTQTTLDTLDVSAPNATWIRLEITRTDNGTSEDLSVAVHNDETATVLGTVTATGRSVHHGNDGIGFRRQANTGTTYWDYFHRP